MNKNSYLSYPNIIYESILTQMCVFLVLLTIFDFYNEKFISKNWKKIFFYKKFVHLGILLLDNCSSCSCKCFSLKFTQRVTVKHTESNQEVTKND